MGKYSREDLKELLEYISSNPAILFPELTEKEKKKVINDVLKQYEEEKLKDANPDLIIDTVKKSVYKLKRFK